MFANKTFTFAQWIWDLRLRISLVYLRPLLESSILVETTYDYILWCSPPTDVSQTETFVFEDVIGENIVRPSFLTLLLWLLFCYRAKLCAVSLFTESECRAILHPYGAISKAWNIQTLRWCSCISIAKTNIGGRDMKWYLQIKVDFKVF